MVPDDQTVMAISAAGGPDVLQPRRERVASPGDDEILIQVHAAGINRHDVNQRRRGPTPGHSDVPGLEVAGSVAALGGKVKGWSVGDQVCALTDGGGYAQFALAPAGHCFAIPGGFGFIEAAALPEALFTVWHNFFNLAQLGPGESVLLHGGTSGVGTIAIQALTLLGHPVYATWVRSKPLTTGRTNSRPGLSNTRAVAAWTSFWTCQAGVTRPAILRRWQEEAVWCICRRGTAWIFQRLCA